MKTLLLGLGGALWLLVAATPARAETADQSYAAALAALTKGADNEAIDRLELLADQGVVSADASLARAAAYLARADGNGKQPGDLGRAVAALSEVLLLRPNDSQAERALEAVQADIARRQSKQQESILVRPRLSRAIAGLLPEQAWAMLAAASSLAIAAGVVLRRLGRDQRRCGARARFRLGRLRGGAISRHLAAGGRGHSRSAFDQRNRASPPAQARRRHHDTARGRHRLREGPPRGALPRRMGQHRRLAQPEPGPAAPDTLTKPEMRFRVISGG